MSATWSGAATALAGLALSPLLLGVVGRTKAVVAGRRGAPLLQPYWDLFRLLGKGAVYGSATGPVFRLGPSLSLAALVLAAVMVPGGGARPILSFGGDVALFASLLALARFATMAAALDTGSSFEGMGASREAAFSALSEPALFLAVGALAWSQGSVELAGVFAPGAGVAAAPVLVLCASALFLLLLAENSRIPVDDPTTHLELTMIHEVMVLDHSGPDLAFILYGAALKLWLFSALLVSLLLPAAPPAVGVPALLGGVALAGVLVGLVEGVMARLRMGRVPQYLGLAAALAGLAALLVMAGGRP